MTSPDASVSRRGEAEKKRLRPCMKCGGEGELVRLDSGHWLGTCSVCTAESVMHWSKVAARWHWQASNRPCRFRTDIGLPCKRPHNHLGAHHV